MHRAARWVHLKRLLSEYISYHHEDPHTLGTREGNTRRQNSLSAFRSHMVTAATGRAAPPLRSGCLT